LTKFKNYEILLNNISHRFLPTTKLYAGRKSFIVENKILLKKALKKQGFSFPYLSKNVFDATVASESKSQLLLLKKKTI
jgi:hypothetical protein